MEGSSECSLEALIVGGNGMPETVEIEFRDGCLLVALNRPTVMNALTIEMLGVLADVLESAATDREVAVVVLTGRGRAFCGGVDLKELQSRSLDGGRVGSDFDDAAARVTGLLSGMPKPVIAAINGACFTGGLELALACDLILTASNAKFGDTHAKWGLRPTWGMTQRLGRAVGPARARMLSFTAHVFDGKAAVDYGLAVACHPPEDLLSMAWKLATEIGENSSASLAAYKDLYQLSENSFLRDGLTAERESTYEILDSVERVSGFASKDT